MHYKKLLELANIEEKSTILKVAKRAQEMEIEKKKRDKLVREQLDNLLAILGNFMCEKEERLKLKKGNPKLQLVK